MTRSGRLLLAALACACAASCDRPAARAPPPKPTSQPRLERRATLDLVSGEVRVKRADADEWVRATPSTELHRDDKVRTSKAAKALIRFDDGSDLAIDEESLVSVSDLPDDAPGRSGVTLLRGKVDATVDHSKTQAFSVRTPAGLAKSSKEIVFQ